MLKPRFTLRLILPAIASVIALAFVLSLSARNKDKEWDDSARSRKASYTYLQSGIANSEDRNDEFFTLINHAFALDSSDLDISSEWGKLNLVTNMLDSVETERAFGYMMRRFLANPDDYQEAIIFANITNSLGRPKDEIRIWTIVDSVNPDKTDPALYLATAYLRSYLKGDTSAYNKAIATINRIEEGTGKQLDISIMKLKAFDLKNDTVSMVNELSSLYESAPNDPMINLFVGESYDQIQMADSALKHLNIACELDSTNGNALLSRAEFFSAHNDSVAFDREVFKALKSPNLEFESKFSILRAYVSALYDDDTQESRIIDLFNILQEQHPGEASLHMLYGYFLASKLSYAQAAEQFSLASSLDPTIQDSWSAAVHMYQLADEYDNMYDTAVNAMERFPDNLYFPMVAAIKLSAEEDFEGAIRILNKPDISVVNNPEAVASLLCMRGDTYSHIDSIEQASNDYETALLYNPDNMLVMNNYAYLIAEHGGDLNKAERMSLLTIEDDPDKLTYIDTYAWVLFKKQEYRLAKSYIEMAIRNNDPDGEVSSLLPIVTSDQEYTSYDGSEKITDILIIDDSDLDNNSTEQEMTEEIVEYEDTIYDNILTAEVIEHAGDIYFMNGDPDTAVKLWKKALEMDPDREILQRKVKHKTYFFN